DRVVAMEEGGVSFDGAPAEFLAWAQGADPVLTTPAARLFSLAGIEPLPVGVRDARQKLRGTGIGHPPPQARRRVPDPRPIDPVLHAKGLWVELDRGEDLRDVLKGIDLAIRPGERIALMGRNGAGKSTLLRTAAGLHEPVAGKLEVGSIALLTQNPGDYLVRERVGDELPGDEGMAALRIVGLEHAVDADPRDLSGGERQRLALAIALAGRMDGDETPGLVALDEPTRGMDHARKGELVALIARLAGVGAFVADESTKATDGAAVVVATHDV
ncbi:MAG TPA: ABC transporter ATP-binding protein, partial [Solirubrobacterales bacterium]|nr:ABC transporter ATP-binding protein [Solirubrobacterales bacterium]